MSGKTVCSPGRKREQKVKKPEVTVGYYGVTDVMVILGCGRTKAQDVIRQMNDELNEKGYLTVAGRVSRQYYEERFYGLKKEG